MTSVLAVGLVFVMMLSGWIAGRASAWTCTPGWVLDSEKDNSFSWQAGGLSPDSVTWSGSVQLFVNYDANCVIQALKLDYTGLASGGTLTITGSPLVSYTVQYPSPFTSYASKGDNAYGNLTSWNPPAGTYLTYIVSTNFDINARGADEFTIAGRGVTAVVTSVRASFSLSLDLRGKTINAQVHVGPDKCQCKVTSFDVPQGEAPPVQWAVIVHAHEDDFQLFESPDSVYANQAGNHLLFITVTAGDAGAPSNIWLAREESMMASVRYIIGSGAETNGSASICYTVTSTVCHNVWRWNYGTAIAIFMRLPDGDTTGGGFSSTGFQSLAKLRDGNISSMNTVDGSATYTSWPDLYRTVGAIVTAFAPYDATTKINAPDFNRTMQSFEGKNCNGCADHSDHLAVADALYAIAVTGGAPWSRKWYIDYPICWADSRYPVNLDSAGYQLKKALFMAYNNRFKEMTGIDTYAQQTSFWENCFQRQYSRIV
jgi:LmbE family N-acetylglucosaminyl deacetylase